MLYQVMYEFWSFWFVDSAAEVGSISLPEQWLTLLALISTLAIVWYCLVRPILNLFRGRK